MYIKRNVPRKRSRPPSKKHNITCEKCGEKDQVSFHPKGTAPVLCSRCHRKVMREARKRRK